MRNFISKTAIYAAFALAASSCVQGGEEPAGLDTARDGIIGGEASSAGDYPAVGALVATDWSQMGYPVGAFVCTGTLVAPDVVLTAAHCTLPPDEIMSAQFYFTFELDVRDFGQSTLEVPAPENGWAGRATRYEVVRS